MEEKERDRIDDTLTSKRREPGLSTDEKTVDVSSPIGVSGAFISLAQAGKLAEVSSAVLEYQSLVSQLARVEEKLEDCNNSVFLIRLAEKCRKRRQDFVSELKKLTQSLETKKTQLHTRLTEIKQHLIDEYPTLDGSLSGVMPASVPILTPAPRTGRPYPGVAGRNAVIDKYLQESDLDICKKLDFNFMRDGKVSSEYLPASWTRDFGVRTFVGAYREHGCRNRVHKLISGRRRANRYHAS